MKKRYSLLLLATTFLFQFSKAQTTYNDVASIFYNNCTGCHHAGGSAPMPLMNYFDCSSNTADIEADLASGKMPPWLPDTAYGNVRFLHEQIISKADKDLILKWISDGALQGDSTLAPDAPYYDDYAYKLCPEPTMILKMEPRKISHNAGTDCVVLPTNLPADRYLRAFEIVPGNASIVKSVFAGMSVGGVGLTGDTTGNCLFPIVTGYLGTYVPNSSPTVWPDKAPLRCGMLIPANADINLQIQYTDGSLDQYDSTQIRLYFYPDTATNIRNITTTTVINNVLIFSFPNTVTTLRDSSMVDSSRSLLGIYPYAHGLTTDIEVKGFKSTPEIPLIKINKWDRKWSNYYFYKKLVKFPTPYYFGATSTLDNTTNNPNNPYNPPNFVYYSTADTGEVQFVSTQWLRYQEGDENIDIEALLKCDTLLVCRPGAAGLISGSSTICSGQSGVTLSVPDIANAETYVWTYSGTGATINGSGKSVTIDFSLLATSGDLTVKGVNECGVSGPVSASKTLTLASGNPVDSAGAISGDSIVCNGQSAVAYSVSSVSGATEYVWSYSGTGVTINGTSESISLNFSDSATSGNLTVMGVNECVDGAASVAFPITVYPIPAIPTIVSLESCGYTQLISSKSTGGYLWNPGGETTQTINATADGTYYVTVTSGGNCSTSSVGEDVTVIPLPSITSVQEATRCGEGSVTLNATASFGLPTWYADSVGGTALATAESYTTTNLTETTTYYVDATENGCTSKRVSVTATINNGPTAVISGDQSVCAGNNGTLTIELTGTAPWDFTYGLSVGNNSVSGITASTYTVAATVGTYTVSSVSDASGCPSLTGGSGSATIGETTPISISNLTQTCNGGTYVVEFDIIGGDASSYVVNGDAGTLTSNHFTGNSITSGASYSYSVTDAANCSAVPVNGQESCGCPASGEISGGGAICGGSSVTINIALEGTAPWNVIYAIDGVDQPEITGISVSPYTFTTSIGGDYTLSSVADASCQGSISGTATVSENGTEATISGGGSICIGDSINLSFDLTTGTPPWSFTYTDGTTTSALITSNFVNKTISVSSAGTYSIVSMSTASCSGTGLGSVEVTVNSLPIVSASVSPKDTVCLKDQIILSGAGAATYVWSGGVNDGEAVTANSTKTYTVIGTDSNGCISSAEQEVVVKPLPVVTNNADPLSAAVCAGETVTLTGVATGITTFTWTGGITDGVPFVPTVLTTYTVSGTDQNGCTGSSIRTVNVLDLPTVSISASPSTSICIGDEVTLTASGAKTYVWSDGVVDGVAFSPVATKTYTVTGAGDFSCKKSVSQTIIVDDCTPQGVGIEEGNDYEQKIYMYPNPSSGLINISIVNATFNNIAVSVLNMLGKEVYAMSDKNNSVAEYNMELDLEYLSDGIYYLRLTLDNETTIEKLILQ